MKITNDKNISFKQGLSSKIVLQAKFTNVKKETLLFAEKYGIETNFLNSKDATFANKVSLDIFQKLASRNKYEFNLPPGIFLFEKKNLIDKDTVENFCISDTKEVLRNDYPFAGRSIFFSNFKDLKYIDEMSNYLNNLKINSSSHFLSQFIHEWLHSIHLDYIYTNFGYGGDCEYLKEKYPFKKSKISGVELLKELETKVLSPRENEIIFDNLGEYSTRPKNQYLEIFAETFTKLICDSLDGIELIKNPIDLLSYKSIEFQKIIRKICRFE